MSGDARVCERLRVICECAFERGVCFACGDCFFFFFLTLALLMRAFARSSGIRLRYQGCDARVWMCDTLIPPCRNRSRCRFGERRFCASGESAPACLHAIRHRAARAGSLGAMDEPEECRWTQQALSDTILDGGESFLWRRRGSGSVCVCEWFPVLHRVPSRRSDTNNMNRPKMRGERERRERNRKEEKIQNDVWAL